MTTFTNEAKTAILNSRVVFTDDTIWMSNTGIDAVGEVGKLLGVGANYAVVFSARWSVYMAQNSMRDAELASRGNHGHNVMSLLHSQRRIKYMPEAHDSRIISPAQEIARFAVEHAHAPLVVLCGDVAKLDVAMPANVTVVTLNTDGGLVVVGKEAI